MKKIVNLTPHSITLRSPEGVDTAIPSSGICRVASTPGVVTQPEWAPCLVAEATLYGEVEGLPSSDADPEALYVVSLIVLGRPEVVGRTDVYAPGTGPQDGAIRNDKNQVVAVTRLVAAPLS